MPRPVKRRLGENEQSNEDVHTFDGVRRTHAGVALHSMQRGGYPSEEDTVRPRDEASRLRAAAVTKWTAHITEAALGTPWRVTSSWLEDRDGAVCAELTHITTGDVQSRRFADTDTIAACRARITAGRM